MGKKKKKKSKNNNCKDFDLDLDVDLDEQLSIEENGKKHDAKYKSKISKRQKKIQKKLAKERKKQIDSLPENYSGWHIIRVTGSNLDKNSLLTRLGSYVDTQFQPLGFNSAGTSCVFYLETNKSAAEAIGGLNRRADDGSGKKLTITISETTAPDIYLTLDQLKVLREVLSKRFNTDACLLDLTCLHMDPVLIEKDILALLICPAVLKQVMYIIKENIPHLKALNLSRNNLRNSHIRTLNALHPSCSKISALNLEHNKIADRQFFKSVKKFPITELNLQFNKFLDDLKNPIDYIKLARKELPNLKILDLFNIDEFLCKHDSENKSELSDSSVPSTSVNTNNNVMTEQTLRTFLDQYFSLIDTPQISQLIQAYIPSAKLILNSSLHNIPSSVFEGPEKIGLALSSFPPLQHLRDTLSLNIVDVKPICGQVEISGQLRLGELPDPVLFKRAMTVVPFNSGFCCSLDILELKPSAPSF